MTSKERVMAAFHHTKSDRVPRDYDANPVIDKKLKQHFGLKKDDNNGIREALGVDFRQVAPQYKGPKRFELIKDRFIDQEFGVQYKWSSNDSGGYWDACDFPLADLDLEKIENWPMASPDDYDYTVLDHLCAKHQDKAIYLGNPGLGDLMNSSGALCGMDVVYLSVGLEDPAWIKLIDKRLDVQIEVMRRTLEAAKGKIDFFMMGEDLGTQLAPIISLNSYRKLLRPGSSSWVYEDFIDMGVNAIDALQPDAANMSPTYLKENFGDRLAFHGCISTTEALTFGTPQDVEKEVKETLEIMKPAKGYMLCPAHLIQDNSPVENVLALYRAGDMYGDY